ncbi:formylglycine-generating enzyme family protein [Sorangium sp. So ce1153]|uniref:formylglycine-generating enzyme family protein n=1 Tax=Sorangium sp. So ce1153 TaxID=3133333 RepID=UPI003F61920D
MRPGALALAVRITSLLGVMSLFSAACNGGLGSGMTDDASGGGGASATSSASVAPATSAGSGSAGGAGGAGGGDSAGGAGGGTAGAGEGGAISEEDFPLDTHPEGPCPPDMVEVEGYCIDRFEAPNVEGALPLVMESAVSAHAWCEEHGKRLCTEDEWDTACEGPEGFVYPYGNTHEPDRCNDGKTWRAPDEGALNTWPSDEAAAAVEALYQAEPSGARPGCVSAFGVHDMTGNVEEWVVRTKYHVNEYPHVLKGCYWSGCFGGAKPRCGSTNPAHADGFRYYETSFRCCRDVQ